MNYLDRRRRKRILARIALGVIVGVIIVLCAVFAPFVLLVFGAIIAFAALFAGLGWLIDAAFGA